MTFQQPQVISAHPSHIEPEMMPLSLAALEYELSRPFPPEEVKFLPKSPRKNEQGKWTCLALPYADKRAYEDRLNELAFGSWSTPYNPPFAVGNKLVIPVTVIVCDVAHTDYGESFLTSVSRQGEMRDEENSATEAYSQGFRRACAQFRLGRYFYTLPKMWVPYDPAAKTIALSAKQKQQLIVQLYENAGFSSPPSSAKQPAMNSTLTPVAASTTEQEPGQTNPQHSGSSAPAKMEPQWRWIAQQLQHDEARIKRVCAQYRVETLEQLSNEQVIHLTNRIFAKKKRSQETRPQAMTH